MVTNTTVKSLSAQILHDMKHHFSRKLTTKTLAVDLAVHLWTACRVCHIYMNECSVHLLWLSCHCLAPRHLVIILNCTDIHEFELNISIPAPWRIALPSIKWWKFPCSCSYSHSPFPDFPLAPSHNHCLFRLQLSAASYCEVQFCFISSAQCWSLWQCAIYRTYIAITAWHGYYTYIMCWIIFTVHILLLERSLLVIMES